MNMSFLKILAVVIIPFCVLVMMMVFKIEQSKAFTFKTQWHVVNEV